MCRRGMNKRKPAAKEGNCEEKGTEQIYQPLPRLQSKLYPLCFNLQKLLPSQSGVAIELFFFIFKFLININKIILELQKKSIISSHSKEKTLSKFIGFLLGPINWYKSHGYRGRKNRKTRNQSRRDTEPFQPNGKTRPYQLNNQKLFGIT